jgi:subfamily B ATP-binding cassette protein MsbA
MQAGRALVAAVLSTTVLSACLEGVGIGLLIPLIGLLLDDASASSAGVLHRIQEWIPNRSRGFYVLLFCVLVLGAIVAKNSILYLSQVLAAKLRRRVAQNLRRALFHSLQYADLTVFEERSAGELTNAFQREMYVSMLMLEFVIQFIQRTAMAIMYLCVLIYLSLPLTTLTLVLACLVGAVVSVFYRRIGRGGEQLTLLSRRFGARLTEVFGGVRVIRATHSQAREIKRFEEINDALGDVDERSACAGAILAPVAETVAVTGGIIIIGAAYFLFLKPGAMTNLQLMGFAFVLLRMLPLVNQLYGLQGNIFYMSPSILEVEKWIRVPKFPNRPFGKLEFTGPKKSIRFDKVGFTYPNGKKALQEISFEMPVGKTVALVGASGSGKSTIAGLLLRFRQPTSGTITVDGTDYWEFTPESWHKAVGVVEQEAFLFHDSLEDNLAYGYPEATPGAIAEAVRMADLEDVVNALPNGLKTTIGERGVMLSGGERQRLAIARALVRKPAILVLDEATSSLDNVSERQVQAALEKARSGRTVLVIAHRLTTVRHADNIVVLSDGRVLEQGTWDELMARNGEFTRLVNSVFTDSKPVEIPKATAPLAEDLARDLVTPE